MTDVPILRVCSSDDVRPGLADPCSRDEPEIPTIVCLTGSTRFAAEYREAMRRESLAGRIALTIAFDTHGEDCGEVSPEQKAALDELHLRKIDLADEVLVIQPGHYIRESTWRELDYAIAHGKTIRYWTNEVLERETGIAAEEQPSVESS